MSVPSQPVVPRLFDRRSPPNIVTLVLVAGLSALNMSIFLPSISAMADEFGTTYSVMQLAVSLYLAATAFVQIGVGPLSDKFGRRSVLLISFGIFVFASIGAMLAQTVEVFLFFRIVQAIVSTGIVLSRAVVRDLYPPSQSASVIGYVTMGMALVPMLGPMIGGLLDQVAGWRASFAFLTVAGVLVFALCWSDLGETLATRGQPFSEQVKQYPELFGSPRFWGYVASSSFASGAFFALLGGGSFVADEIFGLSPAQTGMALGAPALGYAVGNFFSGRFAVRAGIDRLVLIGTVISTIGLGISLLVTFAGASTAITFFGLCIMLGLGNGLTMPNSMAGMLSVRPQLAGTASGLGGAIMITGGALLSAAGASMLTVETGILPLQLLMFVTSGLSIAAIVFVFWRTARIRAAD